MTGHNRPSIGTAGGGDLGARLAHLADVVERSAGAPAHGLPTVFHECVGAGAMRETGDKSVTLITLITREGQSHVFALESGVADALRDELRSLRTLAPRAPADDRAPITKPGGRLL